MKNSTGAVSIPGLIKGILRRWPILLLCGILFAGLGRVYASRKARSVNKEIEEINAAQEAAAAEGTDSAAADPEVLAMIDRALDLRKQYLANSVSMNLDMTHVAYSRATVSITTDDLDAELFPQPDETEPSDSGEPSGNAENQETAGNKETETAKDSVIIAEAPSEDVNAEGAADTVYQNTSAAAQHAVTIMNAYRNRLLNGMDWGSLEADLGVPSQYLRELCSYTEPDSSFYVSSLFSCVYSDTETSEKLMDQVLSVIESLKPEIERLYGRHRVMISRYNAFYLADTGRANTYNTRVNEYSTLLTQKANIIKNAAPLAATAAETAPTMPRRPNAKLYTILGLILGILLSAYIVGMRLILSGTVLTGRTLDRLGLHRFASLPDRRLHSAGISGLAARIGSSEYSSASDAVAYKIAAEAIMQSRAESESGTIGVVGDLKASDLAACAQMLGTASENLGESAPSFLALPDLNSNLASLERIKECDQILLIAESGTSRMPHLLELVNTAKAYGKELIGSLSIG